MFALLVLAAADFLVVLDGLVVSVALPSIQRDLGFSQAGLQWVVNGYLLAFGGFNTSQQVGNAVVIAVFATVAAARISSLLTQNMGRAEALTGGFKAAFVAACFLVLGAVAAGAFLSQSQGQASPQDEARTPGLDPT